MCTFADSLLPEVWGGGDDAQEQIQARQLTSPISLDDHSSSQLDSSGDRGVHHVIYLFL